MTSIESFKNRLSKIGVNIELTGNYPWVYLSKVNEKIVTGKFLSEHAFTVFLRKTKPDNHDQITDIKTVFDKIRETLKK